MSTNTPPISPDLLEILRDPYAIQLGDQYGPDPGKLTLVGNAWLVSADTGYKYPIRDGIPIMLVDEGARWKDTPVDALPPLPPAPIAAAVEQPKAMTTTQSDSLNLVVLAVAGGLVALAGLVGVSWLRGRKGPGDTQ